ncbi:ATP-binding cassette domain-containing protein [Scardovia wiggsiae]|uniref:ATP-binding cassette domain-containing protein n=1 Tax=Scardovia wiggsiae TaxID=230143 RepID=UPI00374F9172
MAQPCSIVFSDWGYRPALRWQWAVRHLSLTIDAGERVLLMGASGIGKSTILQATAGLLGTSCRAGADDKGLQGRRAASLDALPDEDGGIGEGSILIDGKPPTESIGRCGLVLQDPEAQTVFERAADNVAFGPENMGVERSRITQRVRTAMEETGLGSVQWHRQAAHLSGGQAQRLALAGVLSMRPDALLLDEPASMIDPAGVRSLVHAIRTVLDAENPTMLLVEHKADEWLDIITRVVVLGSDGGSTVIAADGAPDDVFGGHLQELDDLGVWIPQRYRKKPYLNTKDTKDIGTHTAVSGTALGSPAAPDASADRPVLRADIALTAEDLAIGYNSIPIAEHISCAFRSGEITALTGDNGSGKSTLALTLAGLLEPVSGTVTAGRRVQGDLGSSDPAGWGSHDLAQRIQYVFQNPEHQFAARTVLGEVLLSIGSEPQGSAAAKAHRLLERYGLDGLSSANPYTLSGGQKRRLTVAAALAAEPEVLILDEPTFGQDRKTWEYMVDMISGLRDQGKCIVVVTHDEEFIERIGARVIRLQPVGLSAGSPGADPPGMGCPDAGHALYTARADTGLPQTIGVTPQRQRREEEKPSSPSKIIASINPAVRLLGALVLCLLMVISLDIVSSSVACFLVFVSLTAAKYGIWEIIRRTWIIFLGSAASAVSVLLYGQVSGQVYAHWGIITVSQGSVMLALATALRIVAIGVSAIALISGIDPTGLADAFSQQFHLPDRFVYGGLAGMRLFSVISDDWAALSLSRRSRGIGGRSRTADFLSQSFALLVLSIRRSTSLSTAMQARGFGGYRKRSHWRLSTVHKRDYVYVALCIAIPVLALLAAWFAGTFTFMGHVNA